MSLFSSQGVSKGDSMQFPGELYLNIDFMCKWKTKGNKFLGSPLLSAGFLGLWPMCRNSNIYTFKHWLFLSISIIHNCFCSVQMRIDRNTRFNINISQIFLIHSTKKKCQNLLAYHSIMSSLLVNNDETLEGFYCIVQRLLHLFTM